MVNQNAWREEGCDIGKQLKTVKVHYFKSGVVVGDLTSSIKEVLLMLGRMNTEAKKKAVKHKTIPLGGQMQGFNET